MNKFSKEWQNRNGKVFLWPWRIVEPKTHETAMLKLFLMP